jgi:O-methyltransferase
MLKRVMTGALARRGYEIVRRPGHGELRDTHPDLDPEFAELYRRCAPYTMTSVERMYELYQAVRYVVAAGIDGDVVECGVWRGGSSMLAAATLAQQGDAARRVWLYDTFDGMSEPSERDADHEGQRMTEVWDEHRDDERSPLLCFNSLEDVQANMASIGFPPERISLVEGKVEDTIPDEAPSRIALLRLDTDWFESTRHELVHLYPRLQPGGVLIVDDYGHWLGAREAIDGYFREHDTPILLHRIDYTGRSAIKPG